MWEKGQSPPQTDLGVKQLGLGICAQRGDRLVHLGLSRVVLLLHPGLQGVGSGFEDQGLRVDVCGLRVDG